MVKILSIVEIIKLTIARFESWKETMEILNDPELMEAIKQGEEDVKVGRTIDWEDLKKELKITL